MEARLDGHPPAYPGRVALDDLQATQLRRARLADDADYGGLASGAVPRAGMPVQVRPLRVRSSGYAWGHLHYRRSESEDRMPTGGHGVTTQMLAAQFGQDYTGRVAANALADDALDWRSLPESNVEIRESIRGYIVENFLLGDDWPSCRRTTV